LVYAADTLRDSIESAWNLTGRLSKTSASDMKLVVKFFARNQMVGNEYIKAIEVNKINTPGLENEIEYPDYSEIRDVFTISCRYRLKGADETKFNEAEADIEDMTEEVRQIVKTIYSPQAGNGSFHRTSWNWRNEDNHNSSKPELIRTLTLTLFNIVSKSDEVFNGFGGVITFDLSASDNMDSAPGGDYIYTEAHRIRIREGFSTVPILTKDTTNGARVPHLTTGSFSGEISFDTYAKKSDIGSTADKLNSIYRLQSNGQHINAVLLHANTNNEGSPSTLTSSSFVKITSMEKISDDVTLVAFTVRGDLEKPSTYTVV